jgi:hypothetical protein
MYVYTVECSCSLDSNTVKSDLQQHDHPAISVIAQQYSSETFVTMRLLPRSIYYSIFAG